MKSYDLTSLRPAIAELGRLAAEMVLWFKPQSLPLPVITIQRGPQNALGWFAWARWESRSGGIHDEINFVPEHLDRDVFDIAETLLHELVHLANYTAGIRDCTSNQYHNARFRDRALAVGLWCERVGSYGWARTGLTPAARERIALLGPDASAFDVFRLPPAPYRLTVADVTSVEGGGAVGVQVVQVKKKKLSKWSCLGKCASVWAASGTELRAQCLACGHPFLRAE